MRALLAFVLLAGCSIVLDSDRHTGNDAGVAIPDVGVDGARPPVPGDQACSAFAAVLCEARLNCCDEASSETLGDCSIEFQRQCLETIALWVNDDEANYSPEMAALLLDRIEAAARTCDAATVIQLYNHEFPELAQGARSSGEPCNPLDNVVEATYCAGELECLNSGGVLVGTWACGDARPMGGECFTYLECQDGLGCPDFACAPVLADGQECRTNGDCRSGFCFRERAVALFGECVEADQQRVFCADLLANQIPDPMR